MNMFTYKDTQITKFVETRELPRRPIIIPISVPMCIHGITVIANKYDMCWLFVLPICWHALVKILSQEIIF